MRWEWEPPDEGAWAAGSLLLKGGPPEITIEIIPHQGGADVHMMLDPHGKRAVRRFLRRLRNALNERRRELCD